MISLFKLKSTWSQQTLPFHRRCKGFGGLAPIFLDTQLKITSPTTMEVYHKGFTDILSSINYRGTQNFTKKYFYGHLISNIKIKTL